MRDIEDAFGHAAHDYAQGDTSVREFVERDDGLIELSGGPAAYFASFEEWPAYQRRAMEYVQGRVLDVGCNVGRVGLYLQERGHDVVGIDNSPLALSIARQRGLRDAREMALDSVDDSLGRFDTIVMMGTQFGIIGDPVEGRKILQRLNRLSGPGARVLAESRDPYPTKDPDHLVYHQLNRDRGRMGGQVRIRVRYRRYATPWTDLLLVSPTEMREVIEGTGWASTELLCGDKGMYVAILEWRKRR